jgi:hypothetical protein
LGFIVNKTLGSFDIVLVALSKAEFLNEIITFGSLCKFLKSVTHVENSILVEINISTFLNKFEPNCSLLKIDSRKIN